MKRFFLSSIGVAWLFMSSVSCVSFRSENFKIKKSVVYKKVDGKELIGDIFDPPSTALRPAVIVVHGGGWSRHSGDMTGIAGHLANAGYLVFNIQYRLAPANHFPAPVEDVRDAVLWLREHATEYKVDPTRIAGWGYSAGANVLLLAGLDGSLSLKAMVAGGTPSDLTVWPDSPLVLDYIGATFAEKPDAWRAASPVFQVSPLSPPLFMYHGEWDRLVEPEQMTKLATAMIANNRQVKTYLANYHGHISIYLFGRESVARGLEFLKENL